MLLLGLVLAALPGAAEEDQEAASGTCGPENGDDRSKVYVSVGGFYDDETEEQAITFLSAGDRVAWYFMSGAHRVYHGDPAVPVIPNAFDSGHQTGGAADPPCYEFRFDLRGYYPYYCKIHQSMRGTVVVL